MTRCGWQNAISYRYPELDFVLLVFCSKQNHFVNFFFLFSLELIFRT